MARKEKDKMLRIFLSYAEADRESARKLQRLLARRLNLRVFTTDMLSAGENWRTKLRRELTQCNIFMVVLSPDAMDSNWVLQELGGAWALEKPIVPVVSQPEILSRVPVPVDEESLIEIKDLDKPDVINHILERYEKLAA
jgi:hypothetical protein